MGARCIDGIVLVGDKRVTRGSGGYEYEDKIFSDMRNIVIGASGTVGLFDKFRREISRVADENPDINVRDFIKEAEKISYGLNMEYSDRRVGFIDLLVAYGKTRRGELQYVTISGLAEVVKRYQMIGSGSPYGSYYVKKLWHDKLTMNQAAVLGCAVIEHIEENELDQAVGVGNDNLPQIWILPDHPSQVEYSKLSNEAQAALEVRELSGDELSGVIGKAKEIHGKLDDALHAVSL